MTFNSIGCVHVIVITDDIIRLRSSEIGHYLKVLKCPIVILYLYIKLKHKIKVYRTINLGALNVSQK